MAVKIEKSNLPEHIAFIMDGNGRWAKQRGLPRTAGHKAGSDALQKLLKASTKLGIKYMTVYAFSTENWNRPKDEIDYLMELLEEYIDDNISKVDENDYRVKVIGNMAMLRSDLVDKINNLQELTKDKKSLCLTIALSYGGRDEIVRAVKKVVSESKNNNIDIDSIDEEIFGKYLDTWPLPDPDLIIRTSGEERLSNFLIWQAAYSEVYFVKKYWPDFGIDDLKEAISNYQGRQRRFGKA